MPQKKRKTSKKSTGIKKKKRGSLLSTVLQIVALIAIIGGLFYLINLAINSKPKENHIKSQLQESPIVHEEEIKPKKGTVKEPIKEPVKPEKELTEDEKVLQLIKDLSLSISVQTNQIWTKAVDDEIKYFVPIPTLNEDLYFCNMFFKGRMQNEGFNMTNGVETYFYKKRTKYPAQKLTFEKNGLDKKHSLVLFLEKEDSEKAKIAIVATFESEVKAELVKTLLPMNKNLQVAFIPEKKFAHQHYKAIKDAGFPCLLRIPLEPLGRYPYLAGRNSILVSDSKREIRSKLKDYTNLLPDCIGATNYMGSHATAKREIMETVIDFLKEENMYFVDAKTTSKSVCEIVSAEKDLMFFKKDESLDGRISDYDKRLKVVKSLSNLNDKTIIYYYNCKNKTDLNNLNKFIILAAKQGYPLYRLSDLKNMQSPKL